MKKIVTLSMLLILSANLFCQKINLKQPLTRQEYLRKSNGQKTGGWLLLGGGTLVLAITAISAASNVCIGTGCIKHSFTIGSVLGGAMMLGSAPLFIASGKNKRKAMAANAFFKMETVPIFKGYSVVYSSYPALFVKLNLH